MRIWALPASVAVVCTLCLGLQTETADAKPKPPSSASKMTIKVLPELSNRLFYHFLAPVVETVFGSPLKCIEVKCRTASE
jgi:hypothetical protein